MNELISDSVRKIIELNSLEDILSTFNQQDVKNTEVIAQMKSLRAQIPENILRLHDHLRARGKRSAVELRNGVCSGCHMHMAIGLVPALIRGNSLETCQNCGRLLYVLEPKAGVKTEVPVKRSKKPSKKAALSAVADRHDHDAVLAA